MTVIDQHIFLGAQESGTKHAAALTTVPSYWESSAFAKALKRNIE